MNPQPPATPHAGRAEGPSQEALMATRLLQNENGRRLIAREEFMTQEEIAMQIDRAFAPSRATTQELSEAVERVLSCWDKYDQITDEGGQDLCEAIQALTAAHARSGLVSNAQRKGGV